MMALSPSGIALPVATAVAAGLIGSFAVMRRMTLASDAMSHIALPWIGVALLLQVNPVLGGVTALVVGALLIWLIEHRTRIPTEAIIGKARHRLLLGLVSADLARTAGVNVVRLDLFYLIAFALTVALGLRYLGILLMGSLIIIPAAPARHVSRNPAAMLAVSVGLAVVATLIGSAGASVTHLPAGPLTITMAAGFSGSA